MIPQKDGAVSAATETTPTKQASPGANHEQAVRVSHSRRETRECHVLPCDSGTPRRILPHRGPTIARIAGAATCLAIEALFIVWLWPRWALLDRVDHSAAILAITLLIIAAVGCLLLGRRS